MRARLPFNVYLMASAMLLAMPTFLSPIASAALRPNVILIMADDLGYEWLGCHGNEEELTPNLDALAREGMRFDHCYSTPLCTPSRVSIMTGKYNHRNYERFGVFPLGHESRTFGNVMKKAGYATCMAGKWQLGRAKPSAMGFDHYLQYDVSQGKQQNYYWEPADAGVQQRIRINGRQAKDFDGNYGPDIVTQFIIDFIDENRAGPFFVYYPMLLCHAPFQPTPESKDKDFMGEPKFSNKNKWYADMVKYTDTVVGIIVDHLDQRGLREDTLVLFTGDNGSPYTITRFRGGRFDGRKGQLTDAGTHVPLIASWPGTVRAGTVSNDLVDFTDFYATLAGAANVEAGPDIDGVSFLPQLSGQPATPRAWAFMYYTPNQPKPQSKEKNGYWARTRDWKLYHDGRLHDMRKDVREARPYSPSTDTPAGKKVRAQLEGAFQELGVTPDMLK